MFGSSGAAGSIFPVASLNGLTPWMWKTGVFASFTRLSPARPTKLRLICARTRWPELPSSMLGISDSDERHQHVVGAGGERAQLLQERHQPRVQLHEARHRVPQVGREALQLALLHEAARLGEPRDRGVKRGHRGAHAGQRLAREGAQRGQGRVQRASAGVAHAQRVAQRGHGRLERRVLARDRARRGVEVGHELLERLRVVRQRGEGPLLAAQQPLDVAVGIHAEQRVVGERAVAVGRLEGRDRPVERLRAAALERHRAVLVQEASGGRRGRPSRARRGCPAASPSRRSA